jgi:hypothetical protein
MFGKQQRQPGHLRAVGRKRSLCRDDTNTTSIKLARALDRCERLGELERDTARLARVLLSEQAGWDATNT